MKALKKGRTDDKARLPFALRGNGGKYFQLPRFGFNLKKWIIYGLKIAVPFIFISDSNNQTQIKILKEIQVINLFYRYSCAS